MSLKVNVTATKCNGSLRILLLLTSEWKLLQRVNPVLNSGKERANKLICQILPLSKISGHSFLRKYYSPMVSILCYLFSFIFQSVILEVLKVYHGIHKGCTCRLRKLTVLRNSHYPLIHQFHNLSLLT